MANSKLLPTVPSSADPAADRIAARQAALKEAKARYAALRKVHRAIAADLARFDDAKTTRLISRALRNVKVWESGGIASPYYVRAWRRILLDPANSIRKCCAVTTPTRWFRTLRSASSTRNPGIARNCNMAKPTPETPADIDRVGELLVEASKLSNHKEFVIIGSL